MDDLSCNYAKSHRPSCGLCDDCEILTANSLPMKAFASSRALVLLPFAAAFIVLATWVAHYGPHWPNRDSYAYFFELDRLAEGRLHFLDLLVTRNNEHPVAFHYAVAMLFLKIFPGNVWSIVVANAILLLAFAGLVYATSRNVLPNYRTRFLLACLVCAAILNGSQVSYLLWEFQIWFYIDLAFLALNIALIERYGLRAYPLVALLCLLATGSEAQGSFLWLTAGAHILYLSHFGKNSGKRLVGVLIFALHVTVFLVATWLLLHGQYGSAPQSAASETGQGVMQRLALGITLVGGGFGIRNPSIALPLGLLSVAAWCVGTVFALRRRFALSIDRVAFLISGTGLLWIAAFTVGRGSFGIAWAFGEFHASPLLIPFFAGIGCYASSIAAERGTGRYALSFLLSLVCVVPMVSAFSFGHERSVWLRVNSLLAASAECGKEVVPKNVRLELSGLEGHDNLYGEVALHREDLCSNQPDLSAAARLLRMPPYFADLAGEHPDAKDALQTLWYVYLTHGDLRAAFPFFSPTLAQDLLRWAIADAASGSSYEKQTLGVYGSTYQSLASASRAQ
ncbi:hypothetical protein E1N52_42345 [Paraburkholderia guartelaensis]|uniref:Glycosyltransferase RgtA/B/C/D-like domain-containing protein n=1 Tax=Paraburkholderia guartelaensis TaxID=2546446 RepID=A0A4R5L2U7_9BURK|nr:hypothetical protein [Paraburkholderia guartelaensis]TDG01944.1 hypothetical protein E1N52_42345 [Paraburkholderia guartelaensis]